MKKSYHSIVVPIAARQGDAPRFDRTPIRGRCLSRQHCAYSAPGIGIRARASGFGLRLAPARIPSPQFQIPHPAPRTPNPEGRPILIASEGSIFRYEQATFARTNAVFDSFSLLPRSSHGAPTREPASRKCRSRAASRSRRRGSRATSCRQSRSSSTPARGSASACPPSPGRSSIRGASRFFRTARMLVTERAGRLRVIRNGVLDPQPVAGAPASYWTGESGLPGAVHGYMDIALHPQFAQNRLVYLSYTKPLDEKTQDCRHRARTLRRQGADRGAATSSSSIAPARHASRSARDGKLYMTTTGNDPRTRIPTSRRTPTRRAERCCG